MIHEAVKEVTIIFTPVLHVPSSKESASEASRNPVTGPKNGPNNEETIEVFKKGKSHDYIDWAIQMQNPNLRSVQWQEKGIFARSESTSFNGKVSMCGNCNKQATGKGANALLDS